jgi:predicted ester cyclase
MALSTADVEVINVATGETLHGSQGLRQFLQGWATAFPDSTVETTRVVADEQGAAMEFTGRGTQTGPLRGPMGEIPPTGKSVTAPFAQALEMRQGKVARTRLYFDAMGMLVQLGVIPAPVAVIRRHGRLSTWI